VGKQVAVELKNDVSLTGTLESVDQYLNIKITDVQVVNSEKYPQLVNYIIALSMQGNYFLQVPISNCFIRGSVVRYIQIPAGEVDTELLQDAARKENSK
jgi:U6 snRNA-associated Sm-like protein LSm2